MKNDTNMTGKLKNYEIENRLFNICVGKSLGGHSKFNVKRKNISKIYLNIPTYR